MSIANLLNFTFMIRVRTLISSIVCLGVLSYLLSLFAADFPEEDDADEDYSPEEGYALDSNISLITCVNLFAVTHALFPNGLF